MVDVEHRPLGTFEQHGLPFVKGAIYEFSGIADVGFDLFAEFEGSFHLMREVDLRSVRALGDAILFGNDASCFFAKQVGQQEFPDAQATACHFVFVGRADSARSGSDFVGSAGSFRSRIELTVIRKNQMGAIADVEAASDVDACFGEHFDLSDESSGIDDYPSADNGVLLGTKDAAGDKLENEAILANDDRVSGIVSAGNASDVIKATRKIINNLSLTFVSPLRADHDDRFHSEALLSQS